MLGRVSKQWNPRKKTVELRPAEGAAQGAVRPSRIRREPVPLAHKEVDPKPDSPERDIRRGLAGVALFGIACAALTVGFSHITSRRSAPAPPPAEFGHCYNHSGPNCVFDGDTIYLARERIEIAGLDAPEIGAARCPAERTRGIEAAVKLLELLNRGEVKITGMERDADGQLVRKLEAGGRDVGAAMVSAGVAREIGGGRRSWCG